VANKYPSEARAENLAIEQEIELAQGLGAWYRIAAKRA
jgi:lipocalin